jgi:uncharacterized protein (TIGR03435 family)
MPTEKFDITGKPDVSGSPNNAQTNAMIRKLLADRFQLKVRSEKKEIPVYAIALIPNTPQKLTPSNPDHNSPNLGPSRPGRMTLRNVTMEGFARLLQNFVLDRPVVDVQGEVCQPGNAFLRISEAEAAQVHSPGNPAHAPFKT